MSEDYGNDYITIVDDDGNEFELEMLDTLHYDGESYAAFLPADMDENDPDYGLIILRIITGEECDECFESIDDEDKLNEIFEQFQKILCDDEDDGDLPRS